MFSDKVAIIVGRTIAYALMLAIAGLVFLLVGKGFVVAINWLFP